MTFDKVPNVTDKQQWSPSVFPVISVSFFVFMELR
jgi:hypothetical protein